MTTTPNHSALRALCDATEVTSSADWFDAEWIAKYLDLRNADAAFISAASPKFVLALLDELQGMREENKDMNDDLSLHREELIKIHRENKALREALADLFDSGMELCMMGDGHTDQIAAIAKAREALKGTE